MTASTRPGAIAVLGAVEGAFAHVSVSVTDLDAARAFYGGLLGLPEVERPDFGFPGAWYGLGGQLQLHLIVKDRVPHGGTPFDVRDQHFAIAVADATAAAGLLRDRGVAMHELANSPTGLRQVFVKDPDGNMVELIGPGGPAST